MTRDTRFHHGSEVLVFDARGNYAARGRVVGVHRCVPAVYDIQPDREASLSKRLCGIPEARLRAVGKPVLAYERVAASPTTNLNNRKDSTWNS